MSVVFHEHSVPELSALDPGICAFGHGHAISSCFIALGRCNQTSRWERTGCSRGVSVRGAGAVNSARREGVVTP